MQFSFLKFIDKRLIFRKAIKIKIDSLEIMTFKGELICFNCKGKDLF